MQDAYVKQTIMRMMKIAWKKHMKIMHDKKFNDLSKEVRTKISLKAIFFKVNKISKSVPISRAISFTSITLLVPVGTPVGHWSLQWETY